MFNLLQVEMKKIFNQEETLLEFKVKINKF